MKLEQLMEGVPYTLVQGSPETEINDIIYDLSLIHISEPTRH